MEIARGLSAYDGEDAAKIAGKSSADIDSILGLWRPHRDDPSRRSGARGKREGGQSRLAHEFDQSLGIERRRAFHVVVEITEDVAALFFPAPRIACPFLQGLVGIRAPISSARAVPADVTKLAVTSQGAGASA